VQRAEALRGEAGAPASLLGTETVLVVEDQEQLLRMTGDVLRGYGYTVLQASTPDEALRQSASYPNEIHILLTDVVMPQMRGIELARRLKAVRPGIRAIFMSGYGDRFVEPREPAAFYLVKPFSPEVLGRTLREAVAAGRATGAVLVIDEDPGIRKLLRNLLASAGYQALEAASGKDALQIADTAKIDLVIADLPESEQCDVMTALRRLRPKLKAITMSGTITDPAPCAMSYPGAQAAIAKPIEPDELVPFVARVLAY
jgi:DNA-binding NtrC family response regulator